MTFSTEKKHFNRDRWDRMIAHMICNRDVYLDMFACPDEQEKMVCHHLFWYKKRLQCLTTTYFQHYIKAWVCRCYVSANFVLALFLACTVCPRNNKLSLARQQNSQTLSINCKRTPTWVDGFFHRKDVHLNDELQQVSVFRECYNASWNRGFNCLWLCSK